MNIRPALVPVLVNHEKRRREGGPPPGGAASMGAKIGRVIYKRPKNRLDAEIMPQQRLTYRRDLFATTMEEVIERRKNHCS